MRERILSFYNNKGKIEMNDAIAVIEEYMRKVDKYKPEFIAKMLDPTNPFGMSMLQQGFEISVKYLEPEYNIIKLLDKEGNLIKAY
jgi:hypothetical protein